MRGSRSRPSPDPSARRWIFAPLAGSFARTFDNAQHAKRGKETQTMANYTTADVKRIREMTGAGMMDCKKALDEADGDFDKAIEILRIKGAKDVGKRAERVTANGLIVADGGVM